MAQTDTPATRREPVPLNGVDTPNLFATINVVRDTPALANFQFRAQNEWINGTNSRSRIESFSGAGGEQKHTRVFEFDADHPPVLVGGDVGPTPVEFLLVALSSCLTADIANIAAARGVKLSRIQSSVEGDMDLRGILGLSKDVRNGYKGIRVNFTIAGDAPAETLKKIVDQSTARSAVFDVITNGAPVDINVAVA